MPSVSAAPRVPSYRRHKPTGQAVVTLNGCDIYLGKWNTKTSRGEYDRLIGEWLAGGRCLPPEGGLTINELALRYWQFAKQHYRKDGSPTSGLEGLKHALRPLRQLYGPTPGPKFGPLALKAVRQRMIESGARSRGTINKRIDTIKRVFKWAVSEELIPASVYHGLQT